MNGKVIASLHRQAEELRALGYDHYQIAGIMMLLHTESPTPVRAPRVAVVKGELFADEHPI